MGLGHSEEALSRRGMLDEWRRVMDSEGYACLFENFRGGVPRAINISVWQVL